MGYYASGSGYINFADTLDEQTYDKVKKYIETEFECYDAARVPRDGHKTSRGSWMDFYVHDKYHGVEVESVLQNIAKAAFIHDACVEFSGEDDMHWRFVYDPETNEFFEEDGSVVYESERTFPKISYSDIQEFTGQLTDCVEDYIEEKFGAYIESAPVLCGAEYDRLRDSLTNILVRWCVIPERRRT